ncbi:hypothetical protein E7811_09815 [Aliigemmobacter aestuarii]|uniref:Argininosuccinate lyase n=1 Tax=Aliigemmobacter aestuarii TaxID=1445661 RepID=A0A4S3MME9_9RHOB|nr:hypothetical protein [Gemmobacter aestuarii]THD83568.1 hypothetical protein E7811_09815 [Gemmobacter aestuarii]
MSRTPFLTLSALACATALAACTPTDPATPQLGVGVGIGPNGVRLVPRVTTNVGGANVGVTPGGASVGTNVGGVNVGASL